MKQVKVLGQNILVKIVKKPSTIQLIDTTPRSDYEGARIFIEQVGPDCKTGLTAGDEIIIKEGSPGIPVDKTDTEELVVFHESTVPYVILSSEDSEARTEA